MSQVFIRELPLDEQRVIVSDIKHILKTPPKKRSDDDHHKLEQLKKFWMVSNTVSMEELVISLEKSIEEDDVRSRDLKNQSEYIKNDEAPKTCVVSHYEFLRANLNKYN